MRRVAIWLLLVASGSATPVQGATTEFVTVTLASFVRAESDLHFGRTAQQGGFGRIEHRRTLPPMGSAAKPWQRRDTLDSAGVFDLDAGPVEVTLPEAGGRYLSLQALSEDHFTVEVAEAPGTFTYTRERVATRYLLLVVRIGLDAETSAELRAVHALQDRIRTAQKRAGRFETPRWDTVTQDRLRGELAERAARERISGEMFGSRTEVDPTSHLLGTAVAWGGLPRREAIEERIHPPANDGQTLHSLTVRTPPTDGFWSVSVYGPQGQFVRNDLGRYTLNSRSAKLNRDGSVTLQFGGCRPASANCLPISPGWTYAVRLYRPRPEIVAGQAAFPPAKALAPPAQ